MSSKNKNSDNRNTIKTNSVGEINNSNEFKRHTLMEYYYDPTVTSKVWDIAISIDILDGYRNKLFGLSAKDISILDIYKEKNSSIILINFATDILKTLKEETAEMEVTINENFEVTRFDGSKTSFKEDRFKRFIIFEESATTLAGFAGYDPNFNCSYLGCEIPFAENVEEREIN